MKNRKLLIQILSGIMAFIMILGIVMSLLPTRASAAKSSSQIRDEITQLEQIQADLWGKMAELEAQQNANWQSIEEMVAQKDNIDQQINLLHTEVMNINEQIAAYGLLIAEKQTELDDAQDKLAELNAQNKERIRAMEEEGTMSYWSVLFKANSFTDLLDRLNMIEEIAEADERRLQAMDAAAQEVAEARDSLEAEKVELEASRTELAAAQTQLEEKRTEADEILIELDEKKREMAAEYEEMEAEEASFSASIAKKEAEFTAAKQAEEAAAAAAAAAAAQQNTSNGGGGSGSASSGSSGWYRPCSYISLTSAYGWRVHPITGKNSFHNGVDLANVSGTPIYAAKSGTVTLASYNGVYGYYVTINHGDGYSTLYGHLTHYVVSAGQTVSGGQIIGYMGSTGWSTGPHLHYTVYYNGSTVNPAAFL